MSWSQRLPGLQESQPLVESLPVAVAELAVGSRAGPPPEPEPALARWESADAERSAGAEVAASSSATAAVEASEPQAPAPAVSPEVPVPPPLAGHAASPVDAAAPGGIEPAVVAEPPGAHAGPTARPLLGPYTVQIGAFRSAADARAYLEQHRLDDLEVVLEHRENQGREYSVLTFGRFATVREATAAWRRVAAGRELDFWVRPAR
jgi:septal ring-binding cell division protein DamX